MTRIFKNFSFERECVMIIINTVSRLRAREYVHHHTDECVIAFTRAISPCCRIPENSGCTLHNTIIYLHFLKLLLILVHISAILFYVLYTYLRNFYVLCVPMHTGIHVSSHPSLGSCDIPKYCPTSLYHRNIFSPWSL